ncbi:hypothetical protein J1N35_032124 [Gossypium stocksii]|uniref:Uncharacterized protein n=1 Tax=Gossypium stocksii TaxID=47602 RepID=A0A9D3V3V3_9ROSI|nr:hypothetical protein J1N35_032124 [Gossypium stocksii]
MLSKTYTTNSYSPIYNAHQTAAQRTDAKTERAMSRHRRQASRVLPPDLSLTWEGDEQPPKSTHSSVQPIATATPYGSKATSTDTSSNPSTYSSGDHSLQSPQNNPSTTTKPS